MAGARRCGFAACERGTARGRLRARSAGPGETARTSWTREPGENPGRGPTPYARARIRRLKGRSLGVTPREGRMRAASPSAEANRRGMSPRLAGAEGRATARAGRPTDVRTYRACRPKGQSALRGWDVPESLRALEIYPHPQCRLFCFRSACPICILWGSAVSAARRRGESAQTEGDAYAHKYGKR